MRRGLRGLLSRGLARIAVAACCAASIPAYLPTAKAGTVSVTAYRIDIRSGLSPSSDSPYVSFGTATSRVSVLERMKAQSQPIITITNQSTDSSLVGFQLDLSNSAAKITACEFLSSPIGSTWDWDNPSLSAFVQFRNPLEPGKSASVRLSTAAQDGRASDYKMNQTLFHAYLGDCLTANASYGIVSLFSQPVDQIRSTNFDSSGRPFGPGISTLDSNLGSSPLTSNDNINNQAFVVDQIVPVPEPSALVLAASAAAVFCGVVGRRRLRPTAG